ncbi:factor C small subunit [Seminavis robusta]|uniref:Factor C small subunit n=1 Tax=Seminavis robusta TaxID=568900 RepID=A0A9N8DPC9_9STRA|nr:factor C small subunit [Seminavis robusta]|eukprot:Sro262_g102000.1 factor C small subunit (368) ;mRNA; f:34862-36326
MPPVSAKSIPWVELYRPKNLDQVSHQVEVVATLKKAVETGQLPHLLLHGPPGSGKTSVALALCKQLYHPSQLKRRVLELNASDERGISVVRDKIKQFASLTVGGSSKSSGSNKMKSSFLVKKDNQKDEKMDEGEDTKHYPNPPFKIIILDEADAVTPDAQAALRRIIEAYSNITRFILICNYVSRIIEPVASRCAKFRFQSLPVDSMKKRLQDIASHEGLTVKDDIVDEVLKLSGGDMRKAVTTLQCVHSLGGSSSCNVTTETIYEMVGLCTPGVFDALWEDIWSGEIGRVQKTVDDICADGFSAQFLLDGLTDKVVSSDKINDMAKATIAIKIAEAEKMMIDGADEGLQLMNVCSHALTAVATSKK